MLDTRTNAPPDAGLARHMVQQAVAKTWASLMTWAIEAPPGLPNARKPRALEFYEHSVDWLISWIELRLKYPLGPPAGTTTKQRLAYFDGLQMDCIPPHYRLWLVYGVRTGMLTLDELRVALMNRELPDLHAAA